MNSKMSTKSTLTIERGDTDLARVRFLSSMNDRMSMKTTWMSKRLVANVTGGVWFDDTSFVSIRLFKITAIANCMAFLRNL